VEEDLLCLTADYLCLDDTLGFCNEAEMTNNVTIKVFTFVEDCEVYLNGSIEGFSEVNCCNESLCNIPDPDLCEVKKCYSGAFYLNGCVDPLLLTEDDVLGNDTLCISYNVDCSLDGMNDTCTAEEISNGTMKSILSYGDQDHCTELTSRFSNVTCCEDSLCNVPLDGICDSIDCYIGVMTFKEGKCVDETPSLKFKSSDFICTSYIFTCSDNDTECTIEDIDNSVEKIVFAAVSQAECDEYKTNGVFRNVTCCDTNLCNTVSDPNCIGRQCYAGVTIENNTGCVDTVGLYNIPQNVTYRCISYQYKCLFNDSACSAKEIKEGKFKWRFSVSTADFCLNLVRNPYASKVTCCDEDLCNEPTQNFCPINEDLECFDGYITNGIANCANETLLSSKKVQNTSATQCISYLHTCKSGDSFCSQQEIDADTKKWVFTAGNDYDCSQIRGPLGAEYLTCCGINNCNHPWFGYCKNTTTDTTSPTTTSSTQSSGGSTNTVTTTPSGGTTVTSTPTSVSTNEPTGDGSIKYLPIILLLITYLVL
jgi:hypothetical protein